MAVKVGPLFSGKIKLFDKMVAFNWKGLQVFRNETGNITQIASPSRSTIKAKETELASRWFTDLSVGQRNAWELFAQTLNSASREVSNRIGAGAKNIIRPHSKLMSGFNAYISSNLAAFTRGLQVPKDEAPLTTPAPTPPQNVSVSISNFVATVTWVDPSTSMFIPNSNVIVAIHIKLVGRGVNSPVQIAAILPVPTPQTFTIQFVRFGATGPGAFFALSQFPKCELRVQMDTVVSEGAPLGALLSPPSNLATAIVQ